MVQEVRAGRLGCWGNILWLLFAVWLAWGIRHIPTLASRPGLVAYASAMPLVLAGIKVCVIVVGFVLNRLGKPRGAGVVDSRLAVKVGRFEVTWTYQARRK